MNLDEAQRKKVAGWIAEGAKLSEIQNRLASELGVRLTYMEVRFLVDDLKLTPKDVDRPKAAVPNVQPSGAPAAESGSGGAPASPAVPSAAGGASPNVLVKVDQIARPGSVVSGKVNFSDGTKADWYFDASGRLGLVPEKPGYRPPSADLQQFQMLLEAELSKMGF